MNGLGQIRTALIGTLRDAGLTAVSAYDGTAAQYDGAVTAVEVAEAAGHPMALGSYLGETYDAQSGTVRELYGRRLDVSILLTVRAPSAAGCEDGCEAVSGALENSTLPSGLRLGEEVWEAVSWDRNNRMFLRRGTLKCRAYFTAQADSGENTLLDFTLKGVLDS